MKTYCIVCKKKKKKKKKKNTDNINSKVVKLKMVDLCYHQNVLYVAVKNQNLWKNKKQKDY